MQMFQQVYSAEDSTGLQCRGFNSFTVHMVQQVYTVQRIQQVYSAEDSAGLQCV